jgi:hypothetical protein
MKPAVTFLFALVLVAVQAALLRCLGGGVLPVTLALPCIVYLGLHGGNVDGVLGSAGVGYILDLVAGGPKGLMTFLAVLLFVVCRVVGAGVEIRGRIGFAVLSALGTFLFSVGVLIMRRVVTPVESAPGAWLLPRMLLDAVLTGFASPVIAAAMRRIDGLFAKEEPSFLK